jgi:hypothetical protein
MIDEGKWSFDDERTVLTAADAEVGHGGREARDEGRGTRGDGREAKTSQAISDDLRTLF